MEKIIETNEQDLGLIFDETPEETAKRNSDNFNFSQVKAIAKIQRYFKFDTLGATFKKEIIGGVSTFLAMVYILSVNPTILSGAQSIHENGTNMSSQGVFLATALATFIGTMIMGLFANIPAAVSTSMGINALFSFTLANGAGVGYEGALITVLTSSIIFVIFSVTPLRMMILKAIPKSLVIAIGIAIGIFIAYVGMNDMGWFDQKNGLPVASLSSLKETFPLILIGMFTLGLMLFLHVKKVPGATIIAILCGFGIALIVSNTIDPNNLLVKSVNHGTSEQPSWYGGWFANTKYSSSWWNYDFSGFSSNIKSAFKEFGNSKIWSSSTVYISIFVFIFLNFFDATGTFSAFNLQLNKRTNQHQQLSSKGMIADSISTVVGASLGTSSMGVFIESSAGIEQGARTGFASIVTGLLFAASIALAPIFKAIPGCVTAAACVYVGIMMIKEIKEVEWTKPEFAISTFFAILFMVTTYSIANGVAGAIIGYTFMMLITKKHKEVNPLLYVLSIIFIGYFVSFAFIQ